MTPQIGISVIIFQSSQSIFPRRILDELTALEMEQEIIWLSRDPSVVSVDVPKSSPPGTRKTKNIAWNGRGEISAIRRAFREAEKEFIVFHPADRILHVTDYHRLIKPLQSGEAEVVFGSRALTAQPGHFSIATRFLTALSNWTTRSKRTDLFSGCMAIRTDIIRDIPLSQSGRNLEVEIAAKVAKLGCQICEVPIPATEDPLFPRDLRLRETISTAGSILRNWLSHDVGATGHYTLARMAELGKYNSRLYDGMKDFVGRRVLEIGAGVGNMSQFLVDQEFLLLTDYDSKYLRLLRLKFGSKSNVRVEPLDLNLFQAQELQKYSLDTIICLNVLEHISDDLRVLLELKASLTPGGKLILLVPAHAWLYSPIDKNLGHFRRYGKTELLDKLQAVGFRVEKCVFQNWIGAVGWLLFGGILRRPYISRVATRGFWLVSWLQSLEEWIPMPFGLSLVVVARRP